MSKHKAPLYLCEVLFILPSRPYRQYDIEAESNNQRQIDDEVIIEASVGEDVAEVNCVGCDHKTTAEHCQVIAVAADHIGSSRAHLEKNQHINMGCPNIIISKLLTCSVPKYFVLDPPWSWTPMSQSSFVN